MIFKRGFVKIGLICLVTVFVSSPIFAVNPMEGTEGRDADGIAWLYDSPLTVFEEITPIDGGLYKYSYSFSNSDTNNIWLFNIFTNFQAQFPATPFIVTDQYPGWFATTISVGDVSSVYDGRNLDSNIIWTGQSFSVPYPESEYPITPGTFVEGFSFVGKEFDPSPKYYCYETVENGWAYETGWVAAVGLTENGVVANTPTSMGQIKCLFR